MKYAILNSITSEDTEIIFDGVLNSHEHRNFKKHEHEINGVTAEYKFQNNPEKSDHSQMVRIRRSSESIRGASARLFLLPGGVVILKTKLANQEAEGIAKAEAAVEEISTDENLKEAISELDLIDLNQILFSCDVEERANRGAEFGVYNLPGYGPFPYAGFAGLYQERY